MALPGGMFGSALAAAAQRGDAAIIQFLLDQGANPNMPLRHGRYGSALEVVVYKGGSVSFEGIHNQPVNETVLMSLARSRHTKMVELLIDGGADVNMPFKHGKNALAVALELNKPHLVKILIERGAKEF